MRGREILVYRFHSMGNPILRVEVFDFNALQTANNKVDQNVLDRENSY